MKPLAKSPKPLKSLAASPAVEPLAAEASLDAVATLLDAVRQDVAQTSPSAAAPNSSTAPPTSNAPRANAASSLRLNSAMTRPGLQVQSLHGRLHQLAVAGGERSATLIAFLQLAREATGTKVAAFLGRDATGQLALERLDGPANLVPSDALLDCARVAGERGLQQRRTVGDWCLLAQPVAGCGTLPEVVLVVGP